MLVSKIQTERPQPRGSFRPKLVIFDLDGTLIEFPREFLFTETERILPLLSHPQVARSELESCFCDFDFFRFATTENREQFIEQFWAEFNWASFPAPETLGCVGKALAAIAQNGCKMAIATARSTAQDQLRLDLAATGFLDHMEYVASRNPAQHNWMDKREQIAEVCDALQIQPQDAIMVGDVPPDILSAKEAGVGLTVAVLSGGIRREVLERAQPDIIIPDLAELPELIFSAAADAPSEIN